MGEGKSRQFLAWLAALLFERHKKIGPPFSGPKLLEVSTSWHRRHRTTVQ